MRGDQIAFPVGVSVLDRLFKRMTFQKDEQPGDFDQVFTRGRGHKETALFGRIIAISVFEDIPSYVAEYAMVKPDRKKVVQEIRKAFDDTLAGHDDIERVTLAGKPGVVIATYAEEIGADLIVTGASRPGSKGYALGSTASRLARRAPCSVFVIR